MNGYAATFALNCPTTSRTHLIHLGCKPRRTGQEVTARLTSSTVADRPSWEYTCKGKKLLFDKINSFHEFTYPT